MIKTQFYRLAQILGLSIALLGSVLFTLSHSKVAVGSGAVLDSTTFTSPLNPLTMTYKVHLPLVLRPYEWHKVGAALAAVSNSGDSLKGTQVFTGFTNYWYHAWGSACMDWIDPSDPVNRDIPMVRTGMITNFLSTTQYGPCNDGRPILVLNEPEASLQDNLTITQTLYYITAVANSNWKGPVYVGGILIKNEDYISRVLDLWAASHGGSRLIPGVTGFHVHPYVNFIPGFDYELTATQLLPLVDQDAQRVRDFVAHRKAEGYSGSIIVSEFGLLGQIEVLHTRKDSEMVAVFERYVQDFDTIPEIQGWAWFADFSPSTPGPDYWDLSNLVFEDGTLTPTGEKFREKLMLYP